MMTQPNFSSMPAIHKMYITPLGLDYQNSLKFEPSPLRQNQASSINDLNLQQKVSHFRNTQQISAHLQEEIKSDSKYILGLIQKASVQILKTRGDSQEVMQLPPINIRQKLILRDQKKSMPSYQLDLNQFKKCHISYVDPEQGSLVKMISKTIIERERIERISLRHKNNANARHIRYRESPDTQIELTNVDADAEEFHKIKEQYTENLKLFLEPNQYNRRMQESMKAFHKKKYADQWKLQTKMNGDI